jgi:hypothetical protein
MRLYEWDWEWSMKPHEVLKPEIRNQKSECMLKTRIEEVAWASRPCLFSSTKTTGETPVLQVLQSPQSRNEVSSDFLVIMLVTVILGFMVAAAQPLRSLFHLLQEFSWDAKI